MVILCHYAVTLLHRNCNKLNKLGCIFHLWTKQQKAETEKETEAVVELLTARKKITHHIWEGCKQTTKKQLKQQPRISYRQIEKIFKQNAREQHSGINERKYYRSSTVRSWQTGCLQVSTAHAIFSVCL